MEENRELVEVEKLYSYKFMDEAKKTTTVLNVPFLKKLLNSDYILLEETEHK